VTLSVSALMLWGILSLVCSGLGLPVWIPILVGALLFILATFLPQQKRALVALLGASLILSGLSLLLQSEINKPEWLIDFANSKSKGFVEVEVISRPKVIFTDFSNRPVYGAQVRLTKLDEQIASGRGFLIYNEAKLSRGIIAEFEGKFEPAGLSARDSFVLKPLVEITVISEPTGQLAWFNQLRSDYLKNLSGVTPDSKALVAGLAIGETSQLSETLEQQMRTVSLTHLVAVSGANCAIVVGMVYLVALRLRFGVAGRTIISLSALVGYVLLVGPDPSVLRAAVMTASVIFMLCLGRRTWALNALAIAAVVLLIADPWLSLEFGFGLSLLATAGILLLAPVLSERLATKMPKPLALGLAVTASAQLLCLPLLLQLQDGLPTYSIIANLFAGPLVAPVTVIGIVAVVLTPIVPLLVGPLTWLASTGTFVIEIVAVFFAGLPVAYFPWATGTLATALSIGIILMVSAWLRSDQPRLRQVSISGLVIVVAASLSVPAASEVLGDAWPIQNWQLVACDVGQGDGFVVRSLNRVAVIDVGRDEQLINSCLTELGVTKIDLLVLTHFDFDHVGGLSGALGGRSISNAIISGFPDDRPATADSLDQLKEGGANLIIADPTISGTLGEFSWRVLAPSKKASEAKDSNDASVTMIFSSENLDMLFLGDLGQSGQERIQKAVAKVLQKSEKPLLLKVSHHGSNDQSASFHNQLEPDLAIISVGTQNGYGHPGKGLLEILRQSGAQVLRTDLLGAISVGLSQNSLSWSATGR
jgi:competence protein ComEC